MTFEDLPDNLRDVPLPDLVVADVLDLFVGPSERRRGAAVFLLCDERDRIVVPVVVDDMPRDPAPDERRRCLHAVTGGAAHSGAESVLVAVARPGHPTPTDADLGWLSDAVEVCRDRVRLLGVHVCTPAGTFRLDAA